MAVPESNELVLTPKNKPMTNARKAHAKKVATTTVPTFEPHLRVLSANQRKTVAVITKDWQRFTGGVFSEMFDKI